MKTNYKNLIGQKYGKLTAIGVDDRGTRKTYWFCQCECGNIKSVRSDSLQCGAIQSCGCLKKEQDKINLTKHHSHLQSGTRLYQVWQGMKARCYNKNDARYYNYGGRGIVVCDEWLNDFANFYQWALLNGYFETLTIERKDVNGNYEPSNCTFATIKEQCNNKTNNIKITIGETTKTLTEWCEIFNLNYKTIIARYHRGDIDIDRLFRPIMPIPR